MELKCFIVSRRAYRDETLFLVTSHEEERIRLLAEQQNPTWSISDSWPVYRNDGRFELSRVRRLLGDLESLVLTAEAVESDEIAELVCEAHVLGVHLMDIEKAFLELDPSVSSEVNELIRNFARQSIVQDSRLRVYSRLKSVIEPFVAALALVVLSPVIILTAAAVKLTSPGPVFYWQTRVGLRGRLFELVKFRSMRIDAERNGPVWAAAKKEDQRFTPIGRLLRASHLDEVPQFWNVLKGELSLIGPRPERPYFVEQLEKEVPLFRLRTLVKPGITGWAQINQGYANSVEDSRRKLEYDLYYVLKHSPWIDFKVVFQTLAIMVNGGTEGRKRSRLQLPRPSRQVPAVGATRRPVLASRNNVSEIQGEGSV